MKAIITLEDMPDGGINVTLDFGPGVPRDAQATPATTLALDLIGYIADGCKDDLGELTT